MRRRKDDPGPRLPVKTLKLNRCPAIAPLSVLDEASKERLKLAPATYSKNFKKLQKVQQELTKNVIEALKVMDKKFQAKLLEDEAEVDARLYEGFFENQDKTKMSVVRAAAADELTTMDAGFKDSRLSALFPLYKARNFPKALNDEERATWEQFRERKLLGGGNESRAAKYFNRLAELGQQTGMSSEKQYLLEELQLYGQSILPATD
jgi:exodeoxyribonuclease-1